MPFSVVVIAKNEEENLKRLLSGIQGLTDDIVIYDSHSTDNSAQIAAQYNARCITGDWLGYGATKNKASTLAKYDWILSLDADELPDTALQQQLNSLHLNNDNIVYEIKRNTVWRNKMLRYGTSLTETKIRLFNKNKVHWNNALVHEGLEYTGPVTIQKLSGLLLHYTYKNKTAAYSSLDKYARLMAQQKWQQKKKVQFYTPVLGATIDWFKNVIVRLGFLDGLRGIEFCHMSAWYVYKKYEYLMQLKNGRSIN